jgi:hypothetical protein
MFELTFHDLGIPFPLFEAPVTDATDYEGRGRCSLCHKEDAHCFQLGIGADVVVRCPGCAAEVALDADNRSAGPASARGAGVAMRRRREIQWPMICEPTK